jgi:glc operon protein GlcG
VPYQRSVLSLDEARKAMDRMLQEAFKAPDRPVAIAICDDQGELVTSARMDKCAPLPLIIARKKAFTAARTRADTKAFAERLKSMGRSVSDLGEPNLLPVQGGVAIIAADGSPLGGIGVSGLAAEEDEAIARIGLGVSSRTERRSSLAWGCSTRKSPRQLFEQSIEQRNVEVAARGDHHCCARYIHLDNNCEHAQARPRGLSGFACHSRETGHTRYKMPRRPPNGGICRYI